MKLLSCGLGSGVTGLGLAARCDEKAKRCCAVAISVLTPGEQGPGRGSDRSPFTPLPQRREGGAVCVVTWLQKPSQAFPSRAWQRQEDAFLPCSII